jgi:hypothetical protein
VSPGDTYEKYCQRCRVARIAPKSFNEWLAYELQMMNGRGPHTKLDYHDRFLSA